MIIYKYKFFIIKIFFIVFFKIMILILLKVYFNFVFNFGDFVVCNLF